MNTFTSICRAFTSICRALYRWIDTSGLVHPPQHKGSLLRFRLTSQRVNIDRTSSHPSYWPLFHRHTVFLLVSTQVQLSSLEVVPSTAFWSSRSKRYVPFSSPALAFFIIPHRVQLSLFSPILHRILRTRVLASRACSNTEDKKTFFSGEGTPQNTRLVTQPLYHYSHYSGCRHIYGLYAYGPTIAPIQTPLTRD